MTPEIMKASIYSKVITEYYESLMQLTEENEDGANKYEEILEKIKRTTKLEKKAYSEIDLSTINDFFEKNIKDNTNVAECRLFQRLEERVSELTDEKKLEDGTLFENIFEYMMTLDAFKLIRKRILSIKDENEKYEGYKQLVLYHHISKYSHFSINSYAEDVALENYFNIDKMPIFTMEDIDKMFNIDSINATAPGLCKVIFNRLDTLYTINSNDGILNTYVALTALSQIEVSMNYLNLEEMNNIMSTFQIIYGGTKKEQMLTAKRLIKKRLNELK